MLINSLNIPTYILYRKSLLSVIKTLVSLCYCTVEEHKKNYVKITNIKKKSALFIYSILFITFKLKFLARCTLNFFFLIS